MWEDESDLGVAAAIAAMPGSGACLTSGAGTRCLGPDGALAWGSTIGGAALAVGPDGAVTVARATGGGQGPAPLLLVRFTADGAVAWETELDGTPRPGEARYLPKDLIVDDAGDVYVAAAAGAGDYVDGVYHFVGPDGVERWQYAVANPAPGVGSLSAPGLALDASGDLYLTAAHGGSVRYTPHPIVLYRAVTYSVAKVVRFDRSSLPVASEPAGLPGAEARLTGPFPNPTDDVAHMELALPAGRAGVRVAVYDVLGRRVTVLHDGPLAAGEHRLTLDGRDLPAGVYVVRATGDGLDLTQRVTLVR